MRDKMSGSRLGLLEGYLPREVTDEVYAYISRERISDRMISEIRLRAERPSAILVLGKNIALDTRISKESLRDVFKRVCGGAVFAHRDDVARGFVSLEGGIRVGVSGLAKYEGGGLVGVTEVSTLVFRIPSGSCSFARELYKEWLGIGGGMLICSGAGEGKTTAIRALARLIGGAESPRRVVVADERCEFLPEDYQSSHVDILRGYKRSLGVDIAIRTMSAEILIVDEISSREDAEAMLAALGAGVTVIATVHARTLDDAMRRDYVRALVDGGLFASVCLISARGGRYSYRLERIAAKRI